MANTINLGSVVGPTDPKPMLTSVSESTNITKNVDEKGRIIVNSEPLVTGYKYLGIVSSRNIDNQTMKIYLINSDAFVGQIELFNPEPSGSNYYYRAFIPTPFNYSISFDSLISVTLVQVGSLWK